MHTGHASPEAGRYHLDTSGLWTQRPNDLGHRREETLHHQIPNQRLVKGLQLQIPLNIPMQISTQKGKKTQTRIISQPRRTTEEALKFDQDQDKDREGSVDA